MALSCPFPIICPKSPKILVPKKLRCNSVCETPNLGFSVASIGSVSTFLWKAERCSCLASSHEADASASCSAIIFVKGLAQSTTELTLKVAFSRVGEVARVKIIRDKKSKQSVGFAYIWFSNKGDAERSVEEMNGQFVEGRFIRVEFTKPGSCKPPPPKPFKF